MAFEEHAFPEDWGTDLQEQVDWNDAAAFANLVDHPHNRGYVVTGFTFDTADLASNDIIRIEPGRAFLWRPQAMTNDHSGDGGPGEKTLEGALFSVQRGSSGDIGLVSNDLNYIFVRLDRTQNDTVIFATNTTGDQPDEPSLLIGRVDTSTDSVYEDNRAPAMQARRLVVTGETHGGEY